MHDELRRSWQYELRSIKVSAFSVDADGAHATLTVSLTEGAMLRKGAGLAPQTQSSTYDIEYSLSRDSQGEWKIAGSSVLS